MFAEPNNVCGNIQENCKNAVRIRLFDQNLLPCNCLPACTSISFETEAFLAELNASNMFGVHELNLNEFEYSQIRVYIKDNSILTSQREELYTTTNFIADCGGLLGLFLGVSVISFLEIAYFCTIRLYLKLRHSERLDDEQTVPMENRQTMQVGTTKLYLKLLKNLLVDYSTKTTIQGLHYVAEAKSSLLERLWWAIQYCVVDH
jgi:Amiloride-sensitive sodium channel